MRRGIRLRTKKSAYALLFFFFLCADDGFVLACSLDSFSPSSAASDSSRTSSSSSTACFFSGCCAIGLTASSAPCYPIRGQVALLLARQQLHNECAPCGLTSALPWRYLARARKPSAWARHFTLNIQLRELYSIELNLRCGCRCKRRCLREPRSTSLELYSRSLQYSRMQ